MSDELSELIEDYRNIVTDKYAKLRGDEIAKQAIIDYHDKRVEYYKNKAKFYKELSENIMDRHNKGGTMPVFTEIEEFENDR